MNGVASFAPFYTKGSCTFKILFAFAAGEEKKYKKSNLSHYELSSENDMESKFLLNTCLKAGLPMCGWEMPLAPTSCRPEQGQQNNQDVVIASFQLITYHLAQGRQSRKSNSRRGTRGGSNQAVTCSKSLPKWFVSVFFSQRKCASRVVNEDTTDLCFYNQIH